MALEFAVGFTSGWLVCVGVYRWRRWRETRTAVAILMQKARESDVGRG